MIIKYIDQYSITEEWKDHGAHTFTHPFCSIATNYSFSGVIRFPFRSKIRVLDSAYFSLPPSSTNTLIGSCSALCLVNSSMALKIGVSS